MKSDERASAGFPGHLAEKSSQNQDAETGDMKREEDKQHLLRELQVRRIALERRNEELQNSRAELEKLKDRYYDFYNFSPVGFVSLEQNGVIIQINLAGASMLESEQDRLAGARFELFIDSADRPVFHTFLQQIFATGSRQTCDVALERKDGPAVFVQIDGALSPDRQACRAVVTDVTFRKRAEDALRETEELYYTFINATDDMAFLKDDKFQYVIVNQQNAAFLGKAPEEIVGKDDFDVMPREMAEGCRYSDERVLYENSIMISEETVNGRVYETRKFPVPLSGRRIGVGGYIRDVTERKQAEDRKEKAETQHKERQRIESLNRMAGAVAHNFNNLMAVVIGNLELAMEDLSRGAGVVDKLARAMKAADRAAEVSGLMLTYLGQTPGRHELLDLSEVCRKNLAMLQAAMPKNVDLKIDLPSPGPVIKMVAPQMIQVLTNLVTNAWEATGEEPGIIQLKVKTVSPADIPATYRFPLDWCPEGGSYACLEVSDTGCGIARKDIEKLFDPFFTSKFIGRGMGLPVVLGIVRAHGGAVTVESEEGCGSILRVFLPVSVEAVPLPDAFTARFSEIEDSGAVLLIEDERAVREMAGDMLARLGFAVLEAGDGIEAVKVFRQKRDTIRCVLCDLTMPRMDGWETLAALRKLAPGIPVILTSGYDQAKVMTGDHPEWPQVFLGKPYRLSELCAAIHQALEKR